MHSSDIQKRREAKSSHWHTACLSLSLSMSKIQNKFLKIRKAPLCVLGWSDRRLASGPGFWLWYLLTVGTPSPCCITVTSGFMRKWRSTCLFTSHAVIRLSLWSFVCFFLSLLHKMLCLQEESLNIVISSEDSKSSLYPHPLPHLILWPTSVGIRQA